MFHGWIDKTVRIQVSYPVDCSDPHENLYQVNLNESLEMASIWVTSKNQSSFPE